MDNSIDIYTRCPHEDCERYGRFPVDGDGFSECPHCLRLVRVDDGELNLDNVAIVLNYGGSEKRV